MDKINILWSFNPRQCKLNVVDFTPIWWKSLVIILLATLTKLRNTINYNILIQIYTLLNKLCQKGNISHFHTFIFLERVKNYKIRKYPKTGEVRKTVIRTSCQ